MLLCLLRTNELKYPLTSQYLFITSIWSEIWWNIGEMMIFLESAGVEIIGYVDSQVKIDSLVYQIQPEIYW